MNWLFHLHTLADCGILNGLEDCHTHILPGVDDGVKTIEEALAILHQYETLGVKSVWLTPHIMEDIPNTTASLQSHYTELKAEYSGAVKLRLAAEYMIDNLFIERLETGDLLTLGGDDSLLVETSYFNPPMNLNETLEKMKRNGYRPVLAHPERYVYMDNIDYERLKAVGIRFQLNLFSLTGVYGKDARDKAVQLLKKRLYDCIGTDAHSFDVTAGLLLQRCISTKTFCQLKQIEG